MNNPVNKILDKPKSYPKPKYNKCNQGHTLVEVYDPKRNVYVWDCPTCIETVRGIRE